MLDRELEERCQEDALLRARLHLDCDDIQLQSPDAGLHGTESFMIRSPEVRPVAVRSRKKKHL